MVAHTTNTNTRKAKFRNVHPNIVQHLTLVTGLHAVAWMLKQQMIKKRCHLTGTASVLCFHYVLDKSAHLDRLGWIYWLLMPPCGQKLPNATITCGKFESSLTSNSWSEISRRYTCKALYLQPKSASIYWTDLMLFDSADCCPATLSEIYRALDPNLFYQSGNKIKH